MKRYKPLFPIQEKIYGNNAIVYHRTQLSDLINKVYTTGYTAGFGDAYGVGFYATYDLASQMKSYMKSAYGGIIVKFQVSLENFLFFDYEEFKKSDNYIKFTKAKKNTKVTKDNFIQLQLDFFGIPFYITKSNSNFSSKEASQVIKSIGKRKIQNYIDGMVFTGESDGAILVSYDINRLIPISFSETEGELFKKVTPKNINYIKTVFANKTFNSIKGDPDSSTLQSGDEPITIHKLKELVDSKSDLSNLDTSKITNMSNLFEKSEFNGDISKWDVSNVINMEDMFYESDFNGDISNWDVSNVTSMRGMFDTSLFNQDISNWDVSNVENMNGMFMRSLFNSKVSKWDVANVKRMNGMFMHARFNQDLSSWNLSNITDIAYMFQSSKFNQDISSWDIKKNTNMISTFYKSPLEGNEPYWYIEK